MVIILSGNDLFLWMIIYVEITNHLYREIYIRLKKWKE